MALQAGQHLRDRLAFIADLIHCSEEGKPGGVGSGKDMLICALCLLKWVRLCRPTDSSITNAMIEVSFRPYNLGCTQSNLPKQEQRPNPSKSIVLTKSPHILTLPFGLCNYLHFWLIFLANGGVSTQELVFVLKDQSC